MRIVPATIGNVEAVLRLEREVPEAPHWAAAEYLRMVDARAGSVQRCLPLCWRDAEVVGFAVGKIAAGEAELESVGVRAAARRDGVGRALCEAVIAWAWERGAAVIELEVRASSAGARALYAALGFAEVGLRRGYYAQPVEDAVLMRKKRSRNEGAPDRSG